MGPRPTDPLSSATPPTAAPETFDPRAPRPLELVALWRGGHATHTLPARGTVTVGRGDECTIVVAHTSVSRRHIEIALGGALTIEDLGSSNGTRLGGERLERGRRVVLPPGAAIEIGSVTLVLRGQPAEPGPQAASKGDPMEAVERLIDLVAPTPISVLILGETGAGKEIVAEQIHRRSDRASRPFVRLNCAAIAPTLLEGELFGHERGAFTGATSDKSGLLETAEGGTLLLDELAEIPLAVQAKLLRVIDSREFYRVGGRQPRKLDVRILAATHRDLEALIEREEFRADLYHRLNGIRIRVPPLRERPEEIRTLAMLFIRRAAEGSKKAAPPLTPAALAALATHPWPGNVRELKHVVERAAVLAGAGPIEPGHLMLDPPPDAPAGRERTLDKRAIRGELEVLEKRRIIEALERCGGNQTRAAELLSMSRRTLTSRLDAYGLTRPRKRAKGR